MTTGIKRFVDYGVSSAALSTFTQDALKIAEQQFGRVAQITGSMEEISRAAQSNAAATEESASVAEETTAQAKFMMKVVGELAATVGYRVKKMEL